MSSASAAGPIEGPSSRGSARAWTSGRPGTVPRGLLGMLGLVVAIEAAVARDPLAFSDPVGLSWRLAARSARDEAPGRPVLCVGDSLVKHGMIPKVIAARSGARP